MMAVPIVTATPGHRHWPRWHRRRLRAWTRRDVAGSIPAILDTIPSFSRAELGRLTQHMIDLMDEIDGDTDLEDDDPAGGSADDVGEIEEWREATLRMDLPRYGADQSSGPINAIEAIAIFDRARLEYYRKEKSRE